MVDNPAITHLLGEVDLVGLQQTVAHLIAHGLHEGVGHAAADDDLVHLGEQVLDDGDLVGDLGAAQDGHEGPGGVLQGLAHDVQLLADQEAGDGGQIGRDAGGGGVSAVDGAEGVGHVQLRVIRQLLGKLGIVLLLSALISEILEKHYLAGLKLGGKRGSAFTDDVGSHFNFLTEKLGDRVTISNQNASGDIPTCATIVGTFVADEVDLIMANATPALQAAQAATNTIPVLGTSITDYGTALDISDWTGVSGFNVSGTSDLAPLDGQADIITELFPEAKTVGLLYCSAEPNSKYQIETIEKELDKLGLAYKEYSAADSNEVQSVVTKASTECDVAYIPTDNVMADNTGIINNILQPAKIPVVAGEKSICEGCGTVTLSIDYYDLGYATGEQAYEILVNGKDPADMEVETAKDVTKLYNEENCKAIGLEAPEGYEPIEKSE